MYLLSSQQSHRTGKGEPKTAVEIKKDALYRSKSKVAARSTHAVKQRKAKSI
jgi:hypothetical protein